MNAALWAAKTGLDAQQTRMAVVSNNLDPSEGRRLASIGADLDWYALTSASQEILDIL